MPAPRPLPAVLLALLAASAVWATPAAAGPPGDEPEPDPEGPHETLTAEAHDGRTVEVTYDAGEDRALRAAEAVRDSAVDTHERHLEDWGFETNDPDALEYEIVDGGVATDPGPELDIVIGENVPEVTDRRGVATDDVDLLYRMVTNHESNHHYVLSTVDHHGDQEWGEWDWFYNGFASLVDTLYMPETSHAADSPFYENGGADDLVRDPDVSLFERGSHRNGPLWGFLHGQDGGLDLFHRVFDGREALPHDIDSTRWGPVLFDKALDEAPGAHDGFDAAVADFHHALLTGDGLVWGPPAGADRDWAPHLEPVAVEGEAGPGDPVRSSVGAYAGDYVEVPTEEGAAVRFDSADGAWNATLHVRRGDDWTSHPLSRGTAASVPDGDRAVVSAVRVAAEEGTYTVQVAGGASIPHDRPAAETGSSMSASPTPALLR